jgi:hypothetical protein
MESPMARSRNVADPQFAEKLHQIRQLVNLADHQLERAKSDLAAIRTALIDLEKAVKP